MCQCTRHIVAIIAKCSEEPQAHAHKVYRNLLSKHMMSCCRIRIKSSLGENYYSVACLYFKSKSILYFILPTLSDWLRTGRLQLAVKSGKLRHLKTDFTSAQEHSIFDSGTTLTQRGDWERSSKIFHMIFKTGSLAYNGSGVLRLWSCSPYDKPSSQVRK